MSNPRPSAAKRGYGAKWQRERERFLRAHPHCVVCHLKVKVHGHPADPLLGVVDHKVPHRGNSTLFWDPNNWQTMHKRCHDGPKQAGDKAEARGRGCDANGLPLDPRHHWRSA